MTSNNHVIPNSEPNGSAGKLNAALEEFSRHATNWAGGSWAFAIAAGLVLIWAATGPVFGYSERWQLVINTGTTIVTFLMVFLIQRSQNKESLAMQAKLNELLAAQQGASNELINAEDLSEEQIDHLHEEFSSLAKRLQEAVDNGEAHSIAEAHQEIHRMHRSLAGLRKKSGKAKACGKHRRQTRAKSRRGS